MRIISGLFKGKKILQPKDIKTDKGVIPTIEEVTFYKKELEIKTKGIFYKIRKN